MPRWRHRRRRDGQMGVAFRRRAGLRATAGRHPVSSHV